MNLLEKIEILQSVEPFHVLSNRELSLVAYNILYRRLEPEALFAAEDSLLKYLVITVSGSLVDESGRSLSRLFSPALLIHDEPLKEPVSAGSEGAEMLLITKAHFFTILNECPALSRELMRMHASERLNGGRQ